MPPLGYRVKDRKLLIDEPEAKIVRLIFERFANQQSATLLARQLLAENIRTRSGQMIDKGVIYKMITNQIYIGMAVHKGNAYPGEHKPIIAKKLWDAVQAILREAPRTRANRNRAQTPALLKGLIFDPDGRAMSPSHTRRRGRLYRYYVSQRLIKEGACSNGTNRHDCSDTDGHIKINGDIDAIHLSHERPDPVGRVPAGEIEAAVVEQLRVLIRSPEIIVAAHRKAAETAPHITEDDVRAALTDFDPLWAELFPAEQARIVQLLVARVDVGFDGVAITLRTDGLGRLAKELLAQNKQSGAQRAA